MADTAEAHDFVLHALEGQEERIQRLETGYTDTVAALRAGEKQFHMISDQIAGLGKQVTQSISDLGKRVDGLATQTAEHHKYLKDLNEEKTRREKLRRLLWRVGYGVAVAVGVALLDAAGVDIWAYVKALFIKKA